MKWKGGRVTNVFLISYNYRKWSVHVDYYRFRLGGASCIGGGGPKDL